MSFRPEDQLKGAHEVVHVGETYGMYRSSGGAYLFIPDVIVGRDTAEVQELVVPGGSSFVSRGALLDDVYSVLKTS